MHSGDCDVKETHVVPDRLSVFVGDPGYLPYESLGERRLTIRIYLDGIEQHGVVAADRAQGWLRKFVMADGHPVVERGRFTTEVVRGEVEFRFGGIAS